MSGPFSNVTDSLFENKSVLTENYTPEQILERDEEIEEYSFALKDIIRGDSPVNIFLYGKTGLGKTAVTRYMMDELQQEVAATDSVDSVHVHEINCNGRTLFVVVRTLVNNLLPETASPFPKRGLGTGDAFEELYDQLDRIGGTHLFVFDEIDHLDEIDTLLYELPRAQSNDHVTRAEIGVIGISNNYAFRQSLSPKVKGTLLETEISFSPYDAGELRTILDHRAERAFVDGACDEAAIAKAAAIAAQDTGNARQAIDLLRVGAEVAERAGDEAVTDAHIEEARTLVKRGRLENKIRDQTEHAQYILEAVATIERDGRAPARSKAIRKRYEAVADAYGATPLGTLKSIQDHLSDLHMLGFLIRHERNEGRGGGQYYEYELDLEAAIVLEAAQGIE